jgi:hypothetical protein
MPSIVPPRRESEFVPWLTNLHTMVVADASHFGVQAGTMTDWTAKYTTYIAAYNVAITPETRTKSTIQAKQTARRQVLAATSFVVGTIQKNPAVTDAQRVLLSLPVLDRELTPVPVPDMVPVVDVISMNGWTAKIRLSAPGTEKRGLPDKVAGANIYSFIGEAAPSDVDLYKFEGETSRAIVTINFPPTLAAGTKVFVTACYKNRRFQTGRACTPIPLLIGGGANPMAA